MVRQQDALAKVAEKARAGELEAQAAARTVESQLLTRAVDGGAALESAAEKLEALLEAARRAPTSPSRASESPDRDSPTSAWAAESPEWKQPATEPSREDGFAD